MANRERGELTLAAGGTRYTLRLTTNSCCELESFADGRTFRLPCEFLRVYSPSAEVRGHGPGQEVLQTGKQEVEILRIEPVGSYAVQLHFSDGHDTGIYSWALLYDYGKRQDEMWRHYLKRLSDAGASREPLTVKK